MGPPTARPSSSMTSDRLEVVLDHVAADFTPEIRSFFARVAKVEAGQGPREHHVLDRVVEAFVIARRGGHPTVEREVDLVGAEERAERVCHGAAVKGVRCRVLGWFGVGRSGCQLRSGSVAGFPSVSASGIAW